MTTLVAFGDSFSCGVGVGVAVPAERTWVGTLGAALGVDVDLRATPGASSAEVLREQVRGDSAVPGSVASLLVGLNDVIRSAFDADATHANLDVILDRLCAAHDVVVVLRLHDAVARLPLPAAVRRRYVGRIGAVNAGLDRAVRGHRNAVLLDLAAVPALRARCAWAVDRIHLSEYGHHAVAVAVLRVLQTRALASPWAAVTPIGIPDASAGRLAELRWFVVHAAPWLVSRLPKVIAGRPTGDEVARATEYHSAVIDPVDVETIEPVDGDRAPGFEQLVHR